MGKRVTLGLFQHKKEMMFLEASALTGDAVEDMFFKCARSILSKIETGKNKIKPNGGEINNFRNNRPDRS